MEVIRTELADQVHLTWIPAKKFKTSLLSAQFLTPLREKTASAYALLPSVLRRGTVSCPDMGSLSAKLDKLYGARVDGVVRKLGETQSVGFVANHIDDRFVPGGERLLEPAAALLGEMICDPVLENGCFLPAYFDSEKKNLIDAIRSILNDKRVYADRQLLQALCAGEPYGISRLGDEQGAEKLQLQDLYDQYRKLISSAPMEVIYIGSASQERVEDAVRAALDRLPREHILQWPAAVPHVLRKEPQMAVESLDVTQGKLGMGFSCGSDDYIALLLGNTMFGGSSNSKLFLNVREKLSLCYYASSTYHRKKRLITVSSGIEFENYQKAYDEIMIQLKAVQNGELEDWELEGARSTLLNDYACMEDSLGKIENFFIGSIANGYTDTLEELTEQVRTVSLDRIRQAMETVKLDTVYFLKGKEAEA